MFFNAFVAVIIASVAQSSFAADCARTYTIKSGDYCDAISASQKVSTFQLAVVNKGKINDACTNLVPNDSLCLGTAGEDCTITYVVLPNDTCEGIAAKANTNTTILRLNNPQISEACDNIYVGEVLCTAPSVTVPPIPAGGVVVPIAGPPANPAPVDTTPAPTLITSTQPAATVKPSPSSVAPPAPVADDNTGGDDLDCDDDGDDAADGGAATTTTPAPVAKPTASAPAADDDDDLPFCDELED